MAAYEEQEYNKPFSLKIWAKIGPFLKKYKWSLVFIVVMNLLIACIDIALPLFQRFAIDQFIEKVSLKGLFPFAVVYIPGDCPPGNHGHPFYPTLHVY